MKNLTSLFRLIFAAIVLSVGINLFSACDSCSREGSNSAGTEAGNTSNGQTDGTQKPGDNQDSGSTEGTNSSSGTKSDH